MARATAENVAKTKVALIEAAQAVLTAEGFAGLSTRRIADSAGTQMSQIQYHFGSKEGIILALFKHMNAGLIERQALTFEDPNLTPSQKWKAACDYLDDDFASGYVRVLQELIAAGWSKESIGDAVRSALAQWHALLTDLVRTATDKHGQLGPFTNEALASLIASAFIGAEALILLGYEDRVYPIRKALRHVGDVLETLEKS